MNVMGAEYENTWLDPRVRTAVTPVLVTPEGSETLLTPAVTVVFDVEGPCVSVSVPGPVEKRRTQRVSVVCKRQCDSQYHADSHLARTSTYPVRI